jgi:hypothetical protein
VPVVQLLRRLRWEDAWKPELEISLGNIVTPYFGKTNKPSGQTEIQHCRMSLTSPESVKLSTSLSKNHRNVHFHSGSLLEWPVHIRRDNTQRADLTGSWEA